jgi:hypothetical protein
MSGARWQRGMVAGAVACWSMVAVVAPVQSGGGGEAPPAAHKSAAGAVPSQLLGQWEVTRVLLDLADQPHWGMIRPGDPSLLYRSMTITPDKLWFVATRKSCDQSTWVPLITTWQGLFDITDISRAPSNSAPTRVKPQDYDLKVPSKQRVRAYPVCMPTPLRSQKAWRGLDWMVLQGDELVVRYGGQVIVVLRKRAPDEKPTASFPCDKAASAAEKTICSDVEVAAWDRSVAEALHQVFERRDERGERENIINAHIAWKAQRDKCGADLPCIRDACEDRVIELIQQ